MKISDIQQKFINLIVLLFFGMIMGGLIMMGTYFIINIFSEELGSKFDSITNLGGGIKNLIIPTLIGTPIMYFKLRNKLDN